MWPCRVLMLCAAVAALCGSPAVAEGKASLSCPASNPQPITPDAVHGVITRVQINPRVGRSIVLSVQPGLQDQDIGTWMRQLEEAGVNMAELLLAPSDRMAARQAIGPDDWQAYSDTALLPFYERTPAQQARYKAIRDRITNRNGVREVTGAQQDQMLIAFLKRLETLKAKGQICGNIQFIVLLRRWFPTESDPASRRATEKRIASEQVYAQTMADFLNAAIESHLDHWIAGFMFTEHTNTDPNQFLPISLDLASRINSLTKGWLKSHLMIANGGGFGNQFNGIDRVTCPQNADDRGSSYQFTCRPGRPLDFFGLIGRQTGSFAFGYKLFSWKTAPTPMSYCASRRNDCKRENLTVADWTDYLNDPKEGLGFADLASYVNQNAAAHPLDANVIFVGNAADNMFRMIDIKTDGSASHLKPGPSLIALSTLFQKAAQKGGGWSGRLFMDAYGDQDRLSNDGPVADNGGYLFYVDRSSAEFTGTGKVTANVETQAYWRAWPKLPSEVTAAP